jgi:class 3 adenylate cyclase
MPLGKQCPRCAAENLPGAKFCSLCAAPLDASSPQAKTESFAGNLAGERRHLTILFCDLVGSTTLAAQFDPEEWRATVAGYQSAASAAIARLIHQFRRDARAVAEYARIAVRISDEHGFPYWSSYAICSSAGRFARKKGEPRKVSL